MSIWLGNQRLDGGSARNIGDIFYTTRNDSGLGGAVECNGGTYSTADYTGAGSIGELLAAGKLDYISLSDYATAISTKGYCDKIGWDGTGTTSFKVPTLTPKRYVVKVQEPTAGNNYTWYRLYNDGWVEQGGVVSGTNGTITFPITMVSSDYQIMANVKNANITSSDVVFSLLTNNLTTTSFGFRKTYNAGSPAGMAGEDYFWQVSGQSAIVSDPIERAMFQLFNGTTDEAVATVGTVVAQVSENTTQIANRVVKGHEVIDFQIPTAANGYTWYRKYADGWVEQGGHLSSITTGSNQSISLLVEMLNANYTANITLIGTGTNDTGFKTVPANTTTTRLGYIVNSGDGNTGINWQVSGMAK